MVFATFILFIKNLNFRQLQFSFKVHSILLNDCITTSAMTFIQSYKINGIDPESAVQFMDKVKQSEGDGDKSSTGSAREMKINPNA